MLSNLIIAVLAILCPLLVLTAYRLGIRDGQYVSRGAVVSPIITPTKHRDTIEDRRLATLLENINNYDGTGRGQKDIK